MRMNVCPLLLVLGWDRAHRLVCRHIWHLDHTGVVLCVCCLRTTDHSARRHLRGVPDE